jgi:vitamin B12 transporter
MRGFFLSTACFAVCLSTISAKADDSGVETVVVTATRTPQPIERTGESISVITGADLQNQQIVALSDALAQTPGLTVNRTGEIGQPTSISIRGAETGQTLVLIDGIRINDPSATDEGAVLGDVLVNNIDRVEILRGPQSTLYGSDAIGGVVNIITRRGGSTPFALDASAEGGSFDTYHLNAAANGTAGNVDYGAAANFYHTNGISVADSRNGNPETDGYTNFGATENARWHIDDNVSIDLRGYYTDARDDFDDNSGFTPPYLVADSGAYNTNRLFAGYAGVNFSLFDGLLQNRIAAIATHGDREFYNSFFDPVPDQKDDADKGNALRFEYQGIVNFSPDDQLTFGAESQRSSFDSDSFSSYGNSFARGAATINSLYAQYQKTLFEAVTLTGGVRYDHNSQFGSHTSLKLAGAWQVLSGTTLRANYGDGFKAPTLYEQFSQYSSPLGPLAPETARGWEAGLDQSLLAKRIRASLTYFDRDTRNLIDFQSCYVAVLPAGCSVPATAAAGGYYFNIGRSRASGEELEITAAIVDGLSGSASFTDMTARDTTPGDPLEDLALTRRPHIQESANLTWAPSGAWSVGASVLHVGQRVDQYDSSTTPPAVYLDKAYTVANLFGQYRLTENFALFGRIENLFGTHYEPELGYGAEGRAVFAGVRATY